LALVGFVDVADYLQVVVDFDGACEGAAAGAAAGDRDSSEAQVLKNNYEALSRRLQRLGFSDRIFGSI